MTHVKPFLAFFFISHAANNALAAICIELARVRII